MLVVNSQCLEKQGKMLARNFSITVKWGIHISDEKTLEFGDVHCLVAVANRDGTEYAGSAESPADRRRDDEALCRADQCRRGRLDA